MAAGLVRRRLLQPAVDLANSKCFDLIRYCSLIDLNTLNVLLFFDDAVKVCSGLFSSVDLCVEVCVCVLQVPCVAFLRLSPRREGLMFALRLVLLEGRLQPVGRQSGPK